MEITVYSAPWCEPCHILKAELNKREIPFTEYNAVDHADILAEKRIRSIPVTVIVNEGKETKITGNNIQRILQAIG